MEAGESEGMSHGNVAVIRTRRDGKSRERSMLIRKEGRFPQDMEPTGSGFIKKSTFNVAEQTTEDV